MASNLGIRNNNWLNIRHNDANDWVGQTGSDDSGFAQFDDPVSGLRAADKVLTNYGEKHGISTVADAINRFAPPADDNPTEAYAEFVSDKLGVGPDEEIDLSNPAVREQMISAMVRFETPQASDLYSPQLMDEARGESSFEAIEPDDKLDVAVANLVEQAPTQQPQIQQQSQQRSQYQRQSDPFQLPQTNVPINNLDTAITSLINDPFATDYNPGFVDNSISGVFKRGMEAGARGLESDLEYFKALGNTLIGDEEAAARNVRIARVRDEMAAAPLAGLETFEEFLEEPTFTGFVTQVAKSGQIVPSAVTSIVGFGVGSVATVAGKAVLGKSARSVAERVVKDSMRRTAAGTATPDEKDLAEEFYKYTRSTISGRDVKMGGFLGAGAAEYVPLAGGNLSEALEAGQELDRGTALRAATVAAPQAVIGVASEAYLLKMIGRVANTRATSNSMFKDLAGNISRGFLEQGAVEGITEVAQEGISVANRMEMDDSYTWQEGQMRIAESAFMGFFGGGGAGGAGAGAGAAYRGLGNVMTKAEGYLRDGVDQQVNERIDEEQFGVGENDPNVTTPESTADINAQVRAMFDESSDKVSVWVAGEQGQEVFGKDGKKRDKQTGKMYYTAYIPGRGTIASTSQEVVAEVVAAGGSDSAVGAALGYATKEKPADGPGQVVRAKDKDGNIISEEITTPDSVADAVEAAKGFAPEGGSFDIVMLDQAMEERKKKYDAERGPQYDDMIYDDPKGLGYVPREDSDESSDTDVFETNYEAESVEDDYEGTGENELDESFDSKGNQQYSEAEGEVVDMGEYTPRDPENGYNGDDYKKVKAQYIKKFGEPADIERYNKALMSNALKYADNSNVEVEITPTKEGKLQLSVRYFEDLYTQTRVLSATKDVNKSPRMALPEFLAESVKSANRRDPESHNIIITRPDGQKVSAAFYDLINSGRQLVRPRTKGQERGKQNQDRDAALEILSDLVLEGYTVTVLNLPKKQSLAAVARRAREKGISTQKMLSGLEGEQIIGREDLFGSNAAAYEGGRFTNKDLKAKWETTYSSLTKTGGVEAFGRAQRETDNNEVDFRQISESTPEQIDDRILELEGYTETQVTKAPAAAPESGLIEVSNDVQKSGLVGAAQARKGRLAELERRLVEEEQKTNPNADVIAKLEEGIRRLEASMRWLGSNGVQDGDVTSDPYVPGLIEQTTDPDEKTKLEDELAALKREQLNRGKEVDQQETPPSTLETPDDIYVNVNGLPMEAQGGKRFEVQEDGSLKEVNIGRPFSTKKKQGKTVDERFKELTEKSKEKNIEQYNERMAPFKKIIEEHKRKRKAHEAAQKKKNKLPEPKLEERVNVVQPSGKPVESKPSAVIDEMTEYEQMMATPQKAAEAKAAPKTQSKPQAKAEAAPAVTFDRKKKLGESATIPGQKKPQRKKANPFMQAIRDEMVAAYPELGEYTVVSLAELVKLTYRQTKNKYGDDIAADIWTYLEDRQRQQGKIHFGGTVVYDKKLIFINDSASTTMDAMTLAHEYGHAIMNEEKNKALLNKTTRKRLEAAFEKDPKSKELMEYYKNDKNTAFDEWYADQVALWATKKYLDKQAKNLAESHFKALVRKLKRAWKLSTSEIRKGRLALPSERQVDLTFETYMDNMIESAKTSDPIRTGIASTFTGQVKEYLDGVPRSDATGRMYKRKILADALGVVNTVFFTADGRLRALAGDKFADLFYVQSQGRSGETGFLRRKNLTSNIWKNRFEDDVGNLNDEAVREALILALDDSIDTKDFDPDSIERKVRVYLDAFYKEYVGLSGLQIKQRKNFFPVVLDMMEVSNKPDEFLDILRKDAAKKGKPWNPRKERQMKRALTRFLNEDGVIDNDPVDGAPDPDELFDSVAKGAAKERLLTDDIDKNLLLDAGFLQDPDLAFVTYMNRMIKHVEWSRATNGGAKVGAMLDSLPAEKRAQVEKILKAYLGYQDTAMSPLWRTVNSWGQFLQFITILPFAAIASLPDLAGPIINAKELGGLSSGFKELIATFTNREEAIQFARDVGVNSSETVANAWVTQAEQDYMDPAVRSMSDTFFRYIGLDWFTKFSREFATRMGNTFILRHSERALGGNELSARYLSDLGLTAKEVQTWYSSGQKFNDETGRKVQNALQRFVESSVMRPNAAERPVWASDPHFALIWQLKSYFYAYWKTIMGGVLREGRQRNKELKGKEQGMAVGSLLMLTAVATMPLAMLGGEAREYAKYGLAWLLPGIDPKEQYFRSERMDWGEYMFEITDRSGFLGPFSMLQMANNKADWGGSPFASILGPTAETIDLAMRNGWNVGKTVGDRLVPGYSIL